MSAGAELGLAFDITKTSVREGPAHIKAAVGLAAGAVNAVISGGRGTPVLTLLSKPGWDTRADSATFLLHEGSYTVNVLIPPVAGMKSRYEYRVTDDSGTADATLTVESDIPAGMIGYADDATFGFYLDPSTWQALGRWTADVTTGSRTATNYREVTWDVRRNPSNGHLFVHATDRYYNGGVEGVSYVHAVFPPDVTERDFCAVFAVLCTPRGNAATVWADVKAHLPAFMLAGDAAPYKSP